MQNKLEILRIINMKMLGKNTLLFFSSSLIIITTSISHHIRTYDDHSRHRYSFQWGCLQNVKKYKIQDNQELSSLSSSSFTFHSL